MTVSLTPKISYPDSDGKPMADNTKQFRWIVFLKENLECLFAKDEKVFVAGDLLWYPVEGKPDIRVAPDVMVVFETKKGDRGSYRQWEENNITPQVVFEIISPGNTMREMSKKEQFYQHYGVEEYYIYDPERNDFQGFQRVGNNLSMIEKIDNWISPRLGINFIHTEQTLEVYYSDGSPFLTTIELKQRADMEKQRAEMEKERADMEKQRANSAELRVEMEKERADMEKQRANSAELQLMQLKEFLRQQGIEYPTNSVDS